VLAAGASVAAAANVALETQRLPAGGTADAKSMPLSHTSSDLAGEEERKEDERRLGCDEELFKLADSSPAFLAQPLAQPPSIDLTVDTGEDGEEGRPHKRPRGGDPQTPSLADDDPPNTVATIQERVVTKQRTTKQQRLLFFLCHGSKCAAPAGRCLSRNCNVARRLWAHALVCAQRECTYPSCVPSREVLLHFQHCKDTACSTCAPVRDFIAKKAHKQQPLHHQHQHEQPGAAAVEAGAALQVDGQAGLPGVAPLCSDLERAREHIVNQQRWLFFLRHASKCNAPDGQCPYAPHCHVARKLWAHLLSCQNSACTYPRCAACRELLKHHQQCKDTTCPVCDPVRRTMMKQRAASGNGTVVAASVSLACDGVSVVASALELQAAVIAMSSEELPLLLFRVPGGSEAAQKMPFISRQGPVQTDVGAVLAAMLPSAPVRMDVAGSSGAFVTYQEVLDAVSRGDDIAGTLQVTNAVASVLAPCANFGEFKAAFHLTPHHSLPAELGFARVPSSPVRVVETDALFDSTNNGTVITLLRGRVRLDVVLPLPHALASWSEDVTRLPAPAADCIQRSAFVLEEGDSCFVPPFSIRQFAALVPECVWTCVSVEAPAQIRHLLWPLVECLQGTEPATAKRREKLMVAASTLLGGAGLISDAAVISALRNKLGYDS
jgi:hypothetical protein